MSNNNNNAPKKFTPLPELPPLPPLPGKTVNHSEQLSQPTVQPQLQPQTESPEVSNPPKSNKPKQKKTLYLILGISVGLLLLAVGGFFLVNNVLKIVDTVENPSISSGSTNPGKTTEYKQDETALAKESIDSSEPFFNIPSEQGYNGGTTKISFSSDSLWTGKVGTDNDSLKGGNWGTTYGGVDTCSLFIGVVRDSANPETQWSQPGLEEKTTEALLRLWAYNEKPVNELGSTDTYFPSHVGSLGQVPGKVYRVAGTDTGMYGDTYATLMYDYNTGQAVGVVVSCLTESDSIDLLEQILSPNTPYSIYIDVVK